MNAPYVWLVIAGLTATTVLTRAGLLLLGERLPLPSRVQRALRYAPACALAAIVAPDLLLEGAQLNLSFSNHRLLAALAGTLVFLRTRSMLGTIACGMAVFTALRLL
ncbi:MAG: AzlD domain-containing protein [Polyangiaceae bacterium]|nr:AzlD domain-containing protein [Polyangiaceae bacterium]